MTEPRTVAEITKNNSETIRIALVELGGRPLCDVRILADYDGTGERRPTRKGICFKATLISDLIAALQDAEREAAR